MFFKTNKSKNTCSQTLRNFKIKKMKEQFYEIFFKNQKETQRNNFGDIIKGYFCSGKFCFERTRLENAKKRRNQEGEEKLKEFHRKR